jgi:ABC-type amino acid transport substrate-binding protein
MPDPAAGWRGSDRIARAPGSDGTGAARREPMFRKGRVGDVVAVLAVLGMAALALAPPAAGGGLDDARSRGKLLVGVKTDFPPFGYLDAAGNPQGFDVDVARYLARALFEEEGRLELVPVTSGSRIPFLYSEWIDLIVATMTVTEDRRRVLDFSDPYFASASLLLVPGGSGSRG